MYWTLWSQKCLYTCNWVYLYLSAKEYWAGFRPVKNNSKISRCLIQAFFDALIQNYFHASEVCVVLGVTSSLCRLQFAHWFRPLWDRLSSSYCWSVTPCLWDSVRGEPLPRVFGNVAKLETARRHEAECSDDRTDVEHGCNVVLHLRSSDFVFKTKFNIFLDTLILQILLL